MANSDLKVAKSTKRKSPRGQAMVEYSVVSHFLLLGGSMALLPVIQKLFEGISLFYDGVYTIIETAAL
jgi:hypothetical protein